MFLAFLRCLKQQANISTYSTTSADRVTPLHGSILIRELMCFYDKYEKVNDFLEVLKTLDINCKEFNYGCVVLKNGMYMKALCDALLEVEKLYIDDFERLERALLFREGVPELAITNSFLECGSSVYFVSNVNSVYSQILHIINVIVANNLHGCQILDLCLKFKYLLPDEIYFLLLKYLNRALLKQITSWIVFGELEDQRAEFFIKHIHSEDSLMLNGTLSTTSEQHPSNFSDTPSTAEMKEETYEIETDYLPLHVSYSLASKILNTGKLVSQLRHPPLRAASAPEFENGDFGINEDEILKIMLKLENNDNFDLSNVKKVVNYVWNSVNKVK